MDAAEAARKQLEGVPSEAECSAAGQDDAVATGAVAAKGC